MKKYFFLAITAIVMQFVCPAQYKIGDDVSNVELTINQPGTKKIMKVKDFKGKLLILDFWGLYCVPCIRAMPKLDSLQQLYKDKLQIILVAQSSRDTIENFFRIRKNLNQNAFLHITDDRSLNSKFLHNGNPFHVWINEAGKVFAMTTGNTTNKDSIGKYFKDGITLKEEKYMAQYDWDIPLIAKDSLAKNLVAFSYFMPAVEGVYPPPGIRKTKEGVIYRYTNNNAPIIRIIVDAYNERGRRNFKESNNNVILEVKNPLQYKYIRSETFWENWAPQNTWLYDLKVPEYKAKSFFSIMQEDLLNTLNIGVTIERRKIKHLILARTSQKDLLASKGGETKTALRKPPNEGLWRFQNEPFSFFISKFGLWIEHEQECMFNDQTNYNGNVDIDINADYREFFDLQALRKDLHRYGLDLVYQDLETEVLVIKERN